MVRRARLSALSDGGSEWRDYACTGKLVFTVLQGRGEPKRNPHSPGAGLERLLCSVPVQMDTARCVFCVLCVQSF